MKQLALQVKQAGPLELSALVRAFETAGRSRRLSKEHARELGLALVDALADSLGASALPEARLQAVLDLYPPEVGHEASRRLILSKADNDERRGRLSEVAALASKADPDRGRQVFFSNRASCSACHRIAGTGGQVGPDLSHIGKVRQPRDLAESLLFPSATIANGFESYTIVTASGQQHTGLVRRETAEAIQLFTTDRWEIRMPRDQSTGRGVGDAAGAGEGHQSAAARRRDRIPRLTPVRKRKRFRGSTLDPTSHATTPTLRSSGWAS